MRYIRRVSVFSLVFQDDIIKLIGLCVFRYYLNLPLSYLKFNTMGSAMFFLKLLISAGILLGASELAKRSTLLGALILALPLVSMMSMVWLYLDTRDAVKVSEFARDIFYLVPPSLLFFVPFLAESRTHWGFWPNFMTGIFIMLAAMGAIKFLLK